jgi:cytochrome c553
LTKIKASETEQSEAYEDCRQALGLAEQGKEYIALQLKLYASGERRNDVYGRMRAIASRSSQPEIDGLAAYYRAGFR